MQIGVLQKEMARMHRENKAVIHTYIYTHTCIHTYTHDYMHTYADWCTTKRNGANAS